MPILLPRDTCYWENGIRYCNNRGRWQEWGRWVAFAVIVGIALIIFFSLACFNARRRRTRGLRPYAGTAWMAPPPPYQQQSHQDPYNRPPPPPQYSQSPGPQGYFGGQQNGIELQSPPNAHYGGGQYQYQPPPGPPPPHQNGKP
ncbi:chitin synthesis regulation, resistance to congo red-domain-containing protein [Aspergillus crustosus]